MVRTLAPSIGEKRVVLPNVTWQGYQQVLQALPATRAARLTYDGGVLEISMPLEEHEWTSESIGLFMRIWVMELGLWLKSMRFTTLDRADLDIYCKFRHVTYHEALVVWKVKELHSNFQDVLASQSALQYL